MVRINESVLQPAVPSANSQTKGCEFDTEALEGLLERLPHPILVLGPAGQILYCNRAGREAAHASGLTTPAHDLKATSVGKANELDEAVRVARDGGTTIARFDAGKSVVHWLFQPYRPANGSSRLGAMVVALAHSSEKLRTLSCFAKVYHLTKAETRVLACLIEQGASAKSVAERMGVTVSTVRSHLKNLMQKTRTRHQRSLVLLALSLPEPLLD